MTKIRVLPVFIGIVMHGLTACFPEVESDVQKSMDKDDRLIKEYLSRNAIDAIESPVGYFYKKEVVNATGNQIINNEVVGVYYEIRTTDDQLIESYLDESKRPRLYVHNDSGLVPRAMNFASGLSKTGEALMLYVPSYLGYQNYSYQQLIQPNSNLVIKMKFVDTYSETELKAIEEGFIQDYIEENELEGFEKTEDGIYLRTLAEGEEDSKVSSNNDIVRFSFQLFQLDNTDPIAESATNVPIQTTIGNEGNLKFLNLGLKGVKNDMELEMLIPSDMGFTNATQVFPFEIRKDLFEKGFINQIARPKEPIRFKVKIVEVR
ncbi:FKBP-type peptidyl-prolyl cis-trans isomerase [Aquiflexum lacus]|uniref:FKBP-type peptidyl-prolyl cis-trans isomerase n=1 Tax=Aquiflexum lacus TaxID=2483805 RepID=UPI001E432260|nr:FKBP-type peptidyl-prolyl cis-trans isomerase [Aquiflexum lacus]